MGTFDSINCRPPYAFLSAVSGTQIRNKFSVGAAAMDRAASLANQARDDRELADRDKVRRLVIAAICR